MNLSSTLALVMTKVALLACSLAAGGEAVAQYRPNTQPAGQSGVASLESKRVVGQSPDRSKRVVYFSATRSYAVVDADDKVVWNFKPGEWAGTFNLVSDSGAVLAIGWGGDIARYSETGERKGLPGIANQLHESIESPHFTSHATDNPPPSWHGNLVIASYTDNDGELWHSIRFHWGARLTVNAKTLAIGPANKEHAEAIVKGELAWANARVKSDVASVLKEIDAAKTTKDPAGMPIPDPATTAHDVLPPKAVSLAFRLQTAALILGVHKSNDCLAELRQAEAWDYTGTTAGSRYSKSKGERCDTYARNVNELRIAVQYALLRSGERPALLPGMVCPCWHDAPVSAPPPANADLREAGIGAIHVGQPADEVIKAAGNASAYADGHWFYDIAGKSAATIELTFDEGAVSKVVTHAGGIWTRDDSDELYVSGRLLSDKGARRSDPRGK